MLLNIILLLVTITLNSALGETFLASRKTQHEYFGTFSRIIWEIHIFVLFHRQTSD